MFLMLQRAFGNADPLPALKTANPTLGELAEYQANWV